MRIENYEETTGKLIEQDPEARTAALENSLRRELAHALEAAMTQKSVGLRQLARDMKSSISQVQRLLHRELGGSLTLRTVVRAVDALGLKLDITVRDSATREIACEQSGWQSVQALHAAVPCALPRPRLDDGPEWLDTPAVAVGGGASW